MDEPFGALDAETCWQMQELLLRVASRETMTVLMVTHDIDEALYDQPGYRALEREVLRLMRDAAAQA